MKEELEFMECDTCRAKPGMPILCNGCLHNRAVIEKLKSHFPDLTDKWWGERVDEFVKEYTQSGYFDVLTDLGEEGIVKLKSLIRNLLLSQKEKIDKAFDEGVKFAGYQLYGCVNMPEDPTDDAVENAKKALLYFKESQKKEIAEMIEKTDGLTEHERITGEFVPDLEFARRKLKIDLLNKLKE